MPTELGLARPAKDGWELIGTTQGLASGTVSSVFEDREGSIWLGLWGTGIARWLGNGRWLSLDESRRAE